MATEGEPKVTSEEKVLAAAGATAEDLNQGQSREGAPEAPKVSNEPPKTEEKKAKPEGMDEEHGKTEEKAKEPKPEDKPEPKPEEKQGTLTEYITLEDPAGQAAIDLLKEANVDPNVANGIFAKALESGDLKDVDTAKLIELVGQSKATLIMAGVTDYYTRAKAENEAAVKAVHDTVGGQEAWDTIRDWAREQEKAGDKGFNKKLNQAREMLDKGGLYAETAARELMRLYEADPNTKGLGNGQLTSGVKQPKVTGEPLSRADYLKELKAAHGRGAPASVIASLDARRKAGMAQGI